MKKIVAFLSKRFFVLNIIAFLYWGSLYSQEDSLVIDWNNTVSISKTTATLQVVENPMVRPGSPIHGGSLWDLCHHITARYPAREYLLLEEDR